MFTWGGNSGNVPALVLTTTTKYLFIYKCIVKVFKLEGDFWFLMSAYNWNHFCSTACVLFLASCWIENWKLEKASVERAARCTNYFQICWDATELQRGVSPTNHKRTTINQRGRSLVTKVHSMRTKVKKKWKDLHPTIALRPDWVISFFPFFPFRISHLFQIWENVNFLRSWIFSSPKENI